MVVNVIRYLVNYYFFSKLLIVYGNFYQIDTRFLVSQIDLTRKGKRYFFLPNYLTVMTGNR